MAIHSLVLDLLQSGPKWLTTDRPDVFFINIYFKNSITVSLLTFPGSRSSPPAVLCTDHGRRTGWQRRAWPGPWWQSSPSTNSAALPSCMYSKWAWRPPGYKYVYSKLVRSGGGIFSSAKFLIIRTCSTQSHWIFKCKTPYLMCVSVRIRP